MGESVTRKRKALVIVESPAKARTIGKYLGEDYFVRASSGHIIDLPAGGLGVDIKNGFRPSYRIIRGKEKAVEQLKQEARKVGADAVVIRSSEGGNYNWGQGGWDRAKADAVGIRYMGDSE